MADREWPVDAIDYGESFGAVNLFFYFFCKKIVN